jgi:hypothetical protein
VAAPAPATPRAGHSHPGTAQRIPASPCPAPSSSWPGSTPPRGRRHPAGEAAAYISEVEGFDRGHYAGPVGWMDAHGDGSGAIGLRSAHGDGDHASMYAGADIVTGSRA